MTTITEVRLCPYRQGSGRATRFHLYKVGMTQDDYLKAGGNRNAWNRDVQNGDIVVDGVASPSRSSSTDGDASLPIPTGRGRGRRRRKNSLAFAAQQEHTKPRTGPDREYPPDERVPTIDCGVSYKASNTVDRFWVFATAADESRWRLRQEIYSWAEADMMVKSVKELKWIQPKWWDRV